MKSPSLFLQLRRIQLPAALLCTVLFNAGSARPAPPAASNAPKPAAAPLFRMVQVSDPRVRWAIQLPHGAPLAPGTDETGAVYVGGCTGGEGDALGIGYILALDGASGALRWKLTRKDDGFFNSVPVPSAGRLYWTSANPGLFALDAATGRALWSEHFGGEFGGSGASDSLLGPEGALYINFNDLGGNQAGVFCYSASDGRLRWKRVRSQAVSPLLLRGNDLLYLGSVEAEKPVGYGQPRAVFAYAVDGLTGLTRWRRHVGDDPDRDFRSGLILQGALVIAATQRGTAALEAGSGAERWKSTLGKPVAALGASRVLLQSEADPPPGPARLTALESATGKTAWEFALPRGLVGVRVAPNGDVLVVGRDQRLYALDSASGREKWSFFSRVPLKEPFGGPDGAVYVASEDQRWHALSGDTGREDWSFQTQGMPMTPAFGADGALFLPSDKGFLYALAGRAPSTAGGAAAPGASAARVLLLVKGQLMSQAAAGGPLTPATAAQKQEWRAATAGPPNKKLSPDGAFEFEIGENSRRVIRQRDGQEVVSDAQLAAAQKDTFSENGHRYELEWLPDSRHFALCNSDANTHCEYRLRAIFDVNRGSVIRFNGWVDDKLRVAIVAGQPGPVYERRVYTEASHQVELEAKVIPFYVAPVTGDLSGYTTLPAGAKLIRSGSKPLRIDPGEGHFVFSPDGAWAVYEAAPGEKPPYLISLATGEARQLPGRGAAFAK